jgi:hypothetical protein
VKRKGPPYESLLTAPFRNQESSEVPAPYGVKALSREWVVAQFRSMSDSFITLRHAPAAENRTLTSFMTSSVTLHG